MVALFDIITTFSLPINFGPRSNTDKNSQAFPDNRPQFWKGIHTSFTQSSAANHLILLKFWPQHKYSRHFEYHTVMAEVKSWVFTTAGYPQTLEWKDTKVPPKPSSNHLLVDVKSAALNPVDIQLMNFSLNSVPGLNGEKVVGKDFAGIVLGAAPDTGFERGDEIMGVTMAMDGSGTLTEAAHINLGSSAVVKKPPHMSWNEAASLPLVWLTAYTAIEKVAPYVDKSPGKKVAILGGSSATGIYMLQLASQRAWTILTTCSGRNVDFVKQQGAHQVTDYTMAEDAVQRSVETFAPDAIIDCVGGTGCIGMANKYVTIVGDKTSRATMGGSFLYLTYPRMLLRWFLGAVGLGHSYDCIILETKPQWLEEAAKLDSRDIIIDSVFGFTKVKDAFEKLDTGRCRGKVVIDIQD